MSLGCGYPVLLMRLHRVAVLGTMRNVMMSVNGRARSMPTRTAARLPRGANCAGLSVMRSRTSSDRTRPPATMSMTTMGHAELMKSRLRYEPKHDPGMTSSRPKSAGSSKRLIQAVYSSKPTGTLTSKTLGTAATHWNMPTVAFTLSRIPARLQTFRRVTSLLTMAARRCFAKPAR
eukprot:7023001-Prymnesium_polylepis.2